MLSKAALRDGVRDCYGPGRTAIADKFNAEKKKTLSAGEGEGWKVLSRPDRTAPNETPALRCGV